MNSSTLKRHQIRIIFRRHRGEGVKLAQELGLHMNSVNKWLKSAEFKSKRIEDAVRARAVELLAQEEQKKERSHAA